MARAGVPANFVPCPPNPVALAAGQWALVGNPASAAMAMHGEDAAYVYANGSYQVVTVLDAGQGAWVWSAAGGTLTFTRVAEP